MSQMTCQGAFAYMLSGCAAMTAKTGTRQVADPFRVKTLRSDTIESCATPRPERHERAWLDLNGAGCKAMILRRNAAIWPNHKGATPRHSPRPSRRHNTLADGQATL